jgi:hypothetical protein
MRLLKKHVVFFYAGSPHDSRTTGLMLLQFYSGSPCPNLVSHLKFHTDGSTESGTLHKSLNMKLMCQNYYATYTLCNLLNFNPALTH